MPGFSEFSIKKVEIIPSQKGADDFGLYCLAFLSISSDHYIKIKGEFILKITNPPYYFAGIQ